MEFPCKKTQKCCKKLRRRRKPKTNIYLIFLDTPSNLQKAPGFLAVFLVKISSLWSNKKIPPHFPGAEITRKARIKRKHAKIAEKQENMQKIC